MSFSVALSRIQHIRRCRSANSPHGIISDGRGRRARVRLRDKLGANPLEFVTRATGTLTLVFLLLSLAITPARRLTGLSCLVRFRRMLGLYAFFYGFTHLLTYLWFDKVFSLRGIVEDMVRRPFIAVGMVSFFLMVPLAITSTNAMIKRLGKRWTRLHKAVYVTAVGGIIHYWMLVKVDVQKPLFFGAVLALLLGYRLFVYYQAKLAEQPVSLRGLALPR